MCTDRKKTLIRCIAVRETSLPGSIVGLLETPRTILALYRIEGSKGAPLLVPHYAERRQSLGTANVIFSTREKIVSLAQIPYKK